MRKMLILGCLNLRINEAQIKSFCETSNLTNLIKQPTCYKNPDNPIHYVKSERIQSFSGPHFLAFRLNIGNTDKKNSKHVQCSLSDTH